MIVFKALVIAILANGSALIIGDARGPYKTEAECRKRIVEMVEVAAKVYPIAAFQGECQQITGS